MANDKEPLIVMCKGRREDAERVSCALSQDYHVFLIPRDFQ
jgi:hypothetical protein